uniref:Uncharacterized protein n=1 Tax=Anguilla anguilla TaxID=7936 RepID=A0A0E9SAQ9_ANGAN
MSSLKKPAIHRRLAIDSHTCNYLIALVA